MMQFMSSNLRIIDL